jgi:hypothetical protein
MDNYKPRISLRECALISKLCTNVGKPPPEEDRWYGNIPSVIIKRLIQEDVAINSPCKNSPFLLNTVCCGAPGRKLFNKLNFSVPDVARPQEKLVK